MRKATRKEATELLNKWKKRLNLDEWGIRVEFPKHDQTSGSAHHAGMEILADITAMPVYLRATVRVFPVWFTRSAQAREEVIIHELAHCITQPVLDMLRRAHEGNQYHPGTIADTIETLTERIANAVQWKDV